MTTVLGNLHVYINLCIDQLLITRSTNNLHSTMSWVLSEELAPTPFEAVQVIVAKELSIITLVSMRSLVILNVAAEGVSVLSPSAKSTPSRYQEMVGKGTPVAVHITTAGAPSDTVTVGFCEMVASGATEYGEGMWRVALSQQNNTDIPVHTGKLNLSIRSRINNNSIAGHFSY